MPVRSGLMEHVTWTSSFVCAAAVVACSLVDIILKGSRYCLSNVVIFTIVAQLDGFPRSVVLCYSYQLLPLFRIIHPTSWKTVLAHPTSGICRYRNITFYPKCVSSSWHMMVLSSTNFPILVVFIRFVVIFPFTGAFEDSCSRLQLPSSHLLVCIRFCVGLRSVSMLVWGRLDAMCHWRPLVLLTFYSGSTSDVPASAVETGMPDASGNLITTPTLLSCEVSSVVPAERRVKFCKMTALMLTCGRRSSLWCTPSHQRYGRSYSCRRRCGRKLEP